MDTRYVAKRLGQAVLVLIGVFVGSFVLLYLLPSDALSIQILANSGADTVLDPAELAAERERLGLNGSVFAQFWHQLSGLLTGDLGRSIQTGQEVKSMIAKALPQTVSVAALALIIGSVAGILLGFAAASVKPGAARDMLLAIPPLGVSVPSFTVGLVLINWFAFEWGLLPSGGNSGFSALILPAVTLSIPTASIIAQVFGKSLIRTLAEPYIDTARGKGVSHAGILFGHAFRNAVSPTLAVSGILIGNLLAGSVITETVFYREGLGRITVDAVNAQDSGVVLAVSVLSAVVFVSINLVVDLVLPLVDRRIGALR